MDYDKLFDENLLKQAYESKKKDTSGNDRDSTEDEGAAKENKVSSSQEIVKKATTKSRETPRKDREKLSDFDGEVVFRDNLKSPSIKVHYDEEDSEDKRPLSKRTKRDSGSPSDDENSSGIKEQEAFMKYYQALQSNLQVRVCVGRKLLPFGSTNCPTIFQQSIRTIHLACCSEYEHCCVVRWI